MRPTDLMSQHVRDARDLIDDWEISQPHVAGRLRQLLGETLIASAKVSDDDGLEQVPWLRTISGAIAMAVITTFVAAPFVFVGLLLWFGDFSSAGLEGIGMIGLLVITRAIPLTLTLGALVTIGRSWRPVASRVTSLLVGQAWVNQGMQQAVTYPPNPDEEALAREARDQFARKAGVTWPIQPYRSPTAPTAPAAPLQPKIQAGWYPTADGQHLRWHDGTQWTDHIRPS